MKILLKNGTIIDGTGDKPYLGDILVSGEKILQIGQNLSCDNARVIDAKDKVISPGFIDTHSHSDLKILIDPYNEIKIRQGVTTEVLGQDGISMAPLPLDYISPWRKNLAGLDGDSDEIDWTYQTTDNYLKMLENKGVGLNLCYLVPHGNIRMEAMGLGDATPSAADIEKMCDIARREMKAGAYGLSTGLIYMPCAYSNQQELIKLCKVVAEYDGLFFVHQRSEADTILDSMKEVIDIGEKSGVKIHFSHFKVCGKKNWQYIDKVIALLDEAQNKGIRISFDQYPYVAGSTMLGVILPPWAHNGGTDMLLKRLEDPQLRRKMIKDIEEGIEGWDNFIDFAGLDGIFVTSVKTPKNQDAVGKSLVELGKMRDKDPYNATFDLLYEEENAVGMVDFYGLEEHVIKFLNRPEQNVCTDGLLAGKPHPRVYGAFPRVLGKYVREEKALSLETAIYKMTGRPAILMQLENRGLLKEGYHADVVIFDAKTIIDLGTYDEPRQYPKGIDMVMVNGKVVLENGVFYKNLAGAVLRKYN